MTEDKHQIIGQQFPRKDAVARQLALASCSSNARFARIPALGGGVA